MNHVHKTTNHQYLMNRNVTRHYFTYIMSHQDHGNPPSMYRNFFITVVKTSN